MKTNQELKNTALAALGGNWAPAVLGYIVMIIVMAFASPVGIFVSLPLTLGYLYSYNLLLTAKDDRITENMFSVGFTGYGHVLWGMLLMRIYTFLWTLLFVLPGIIKSFSYAMTPYILKDNPELSANQAIDLSCKMMAGHKWNLFLLYLSFIGWGFLCILTLGIGYVLLSPYIRATEAAFYQDIKTQYNINNFKTTGL